MLNKKQATDLAKAWRLGNRFRKKSLTKKHNIAPATSRNTGRVKMGIRMDVESKPKDYYPAIDDDGNLVFFSGNPIKRIPLSDLFTPPKATKNRQRVPAKENAMINHKLKILETLFPNETDILESFLESHDFDINDYSIMTIREHFKSFKIQIDERTEYQLVAQKIDGTELKSAFYKTENELADMQQKCEDSDEYESTSVMKRIVDVDEDEDNEEEFSSILPADYTDGEEIEAGQNFSEDEVEEGKDIDYKELYKLTNLALKQIPGSPKQRETIKKLNLIRKKAGMKPLTEMEIDINDEVNESVSEASVKSFNSTFAGSKSEFEKLKKDLAKNNMGVKIIKKYSDGQIDFYVQAKNPKFVKKIQKDIEKKYDVSLGTVPESVLGEASEKQLLIKDLKMLIKNPDPRMVKMYGGGNKYVDMLKKKLTKLESIEEATTAQLSKLSKQDLLDLIKVFKGVTRGKKTVSMLAKELSLRKNETVEEDAVSRAKEKAALKKKHDAEREAEKEEIKSINSEEVEVEESKVFDKLKFKGADKKLALSVVDMIKKKAKPKEIAKSFKKLKLPAQELIMKTLGDKSAQDLLQKGQLINQLVSIFDEVEPKGLDGRSKAFREKLRKLEYNKKKDTTYEVWGESTELDEAMKFWKVTITKKAGKLFKGQNVVTKARNSAEAIKKGIKQMKGNPTLVPSGSVTAELDEGTKKVVKEKKLKALQTKSDKTGIPYGILKQVFNRGVAAWRTGHRPGTNPTQWGYARVNSFATKSKGTWGGADKDLAAKARGSMKKK